jgi:hypothetical protein
MPGILGTIHIDKIVMTITKHRIPAKPERKGDVPPWISRLFVLCGGISALLLFAVLIAVRWDPGLADFLFWLTAIWIVLIRYVEIENLDKKTPHIKPKALREWRRYSIKLLLAAGFLYTLAIIVANLGLI